MEHRLLRSTPAAFAVLIPSLTTLLIIALWTPADSQSRVVRTQAVEIVDSSGTVRITMDAFGGKPGVWLYDGTRQRRLGLSVSAQGVPEVTLIDPEGRPRLLLRAGAERAAEVRVNDPLGRPRIGLWIDYRDDPGFWMFDGLARPRIGMKVSGGDPRIWLFENDTGRVTFVAP